MSESDVTKEGLQGVRPGREALTGTPDKAVTGGGGQRRRRGRRGEQEMVPDAEFTSYYGKPVLNPPTWKAPDIPGYLYLGGLAGAGSLLAAGASLTGRSDLARVMKVGSVGAIGLGAVGLVHDLGKPSRFYNMLRVFKPSSPMSVGSWLLAGYAPAAGIAALAQLTGRARVLGALGTAGAALIGPGVAAYTGALLSDTAVPAWHDGYREMPYLFVGSGASAAGGLGLLAVGLAESGPARSMALLGTSLELGASRLMERRLGHVGTPYHSGAGGRYMKVSKALAVAGAATALAGRRSRWASAVAGATLMASSLCTRWGVFHAGLESARDPAYTVGPQRERADARQISEP
ncbi:MAG: NrfD/PsrC family molybdoenzyme membrane anchor subunit [Mycobacteriales bacterium]